MTIQTEISSVFGKVLNAIGNDMNFGLLGEFKIHKDSTQVQQTRDQEPRIPTQHISLADYGNDSLLKIFTDQLNDKLIRLGTGKVIVYSEWIMSTATLRYQAIFAVPKIKGSFALEFKNQFAVVRFVPYMHGFLEKSVFFDSSVFTNITQKITPLSTDDFAEIIAKYIRKQFNIKAPVPPYQKNETIWVVSSDGSINKKAYKFDKYIYDAQTDTGYIKLTYKTQNKDGTFDTHTKTFDYPSSMYYYYNDDEYISEYTKTLNMKLEDMAPFQLRMYISSILVSVYPSYSQDGFSIKKMEFSKIIGEDIGFFNILLENKEWKCHGEYIYYSKGDGDLHDYPVSKASFAIFKDYNFINSEEYYTSDSIDKINIDNFFVKFKEFILNNIQTPSIQQPSIATQATQQPRPRTATQQPISATQGIISSPYTLVFDKPYHSNPPPLSPLAGAYYGSDSYNNGSNTQTEIDLISLSQNVTKPPKCPQISGGSLEKYVVSNPNNDKCILIKKSIKLSQGNVETFCSHVHRALGLFAPDMRVHKNLLFSPLISSDWKHIGSGVGKAMMQGTFSNSDPTINEHAFTQAVKLFIVSLWLVNWDVSGAVGDNTLYNSKGDLSCIDLGGALVFRATSDFKTLNMWKPEWNASYDVIKQHMIKAYDDFNTMSTFAFSFGTKVLFSDNKVKPIAEELTNQMMMLFNPKYNYIEKLTVWCNLPESIKADGYQPFQSIPNDELNTMFVTWLQARAYALWEITRGK